MRLTASAKGGGISPVCLFVSQSSAIAVRVRRLAPNRRTRPSGSSVNVAGMKFRPSFSPWRRCPNTDAKARHVVGVIVPKAGPTGQAVSNHETANGWSIHEIEI